MAAFTPSVVGRFVARRRVHLAALTLLSTLLAGCDRFSEDHTRQAEGAKADMDELKRRVSHLQNSLAAKDAELAVNTTTLETAKNGLSDAEQALNERNTQLRALKTELEELKKRDAFAFADAATVQQQGQNALAVARYQKFIMDYPKSPLVINANYAIGQLTEVQREVRKQIQQLDPARKEKDFAKTFSEGYMTLQELGPYLKKKSVAQVLGLLGRPNQTYNEGTEIGYTDKAVNPTTGTRGTLIVSFEGGVVSTLRVEYAGKKFTP